MLIPHPAPLEGINQRSDGGLISPAPINQVLTQTAASTPSGRTDGGDSGASGTKRLIVFTKRPFAASNSFLGVNGFRLLPGTKHSSIVFGGNVHTVGVGRVLSMQI